MNKEFSYLLFMKMHRKELQRQAATYIERQEIDEPERKLLHTLATAFIQFLSREAKHHTIDEEALTYWVQLHRQSVPAHADHHFKQALHFALIQVLEQLDPPNKKDILDVHRLLSEKSASILKYWDTSSSENEELPKAYLQLLDQFSLELISCNGTEDLPLLVVKAEQIFGFERCLFFSYNPWLDEFYGLLGSELKKVEMLRGKISKEPVFSMKKPLFLKKPAPYVQQVAIDLFGLSSIIFIPIKDRKQLYGWLTFDRKGIEFDCSKQQLDLLTEVGKRLGLYLGRTQLRSELNHSIHVSEKELTVLHLLVEGYSNKEIASLLFLSEFTIRDYLKNLMTKLNAKNRTQLISTAFRSGLVE